MESLKYTKDSLDHTTWVSGRKRLFSFSDKDFVDLDKSYDYAKREFCGNPVKVLQTVMVGLCTAGVGQQTQSLKLL